MKRSFTLSMSVALTACAHYVPTASLDHTHSNKSIPLAVWVDQFEDRSPLEDRESASWVWETTGWSATNGRYMKGDLSSLVKEVISRDLQEHNIFRVVYLNKDSSDVILSGAILRFYERMYPHWSHKIPFIGMLTNFLGVPRHHLGHVDIELKLTDKGGHVLGTYREEESFEEYFSMYDENAWGFLFRNIGARLNQAFSKVFKKIRDRMVLDTNRISQAS